MSDLTVTVYTRPTWTDCQALKEFLSSHRIHYADIDLTQNPEKEEELKKKTGSKIVPGIIISRSRFFGVSKKEKYFIGFEQNELEIRKILNIYWCIGKLM